MVSFFSLFLPLRPLLGLGMLVVFFLLLSQESSKISWKKVSRLVLSQVMLFLVLLKTPLASFLGPLLEKAIVILKESIAQGTFFVFGPLGNGQYPFVLQEGASAPLSFMFQILPSIMVMGSLSMMMFHWGFLPWLVGRIGKFFGPLWHIGGELSTAMAAKVFWGLTEVPLFVKPYLKNFSTHEIFSLMVMGFSTASVAVFALYYTFLSPFCPKTMTLLLTMTFVNIPCSLWVAELLVPYGHRISSDVPDNIDVSATQNSCSEDSSPQKQNLPFVFNNTLEAISQGAIQGWTLVTIISSITLVFVALVFLAQQGFQSFFQLFSWSVSLDHVLGYFFAPFTWLMALDSQDVLKGGSCLAQKNLLNEVVVLLSIGKKDFQPRSLEILIFSLCNFGSLAGVALQSAALEALCPSAGKIANSLGFRALLGSISVGFINSFIMSLLLWLWP